MSLSTPTGFNPFAPGLDFLQSLSKSAQSAAGASMPGLASWAAPTLDPEELDKRITDLKTVHYWLEQNAKALSATIQALEVQRLTLSTLKSMNLNLGDMAKAFQSPLTPQAQAGTTQKSQSEPAHSVPSEAKDDSGSANVTRKPAAAKASAASGANQGDKASAMIDPMLMWTSLTQQFQNLASQALQDAAKAGGAATQPKASSKPAQAKGQKPGPGRAAAGAKSTRSSRRDAAS